MEADLTLATLLVASVSLLLSFCLIGKAKWAIRALDRFSLRSNPSIWVHPATVTYPAEQGRPDS